MKTLKDKKRWAYETSICKTKSVKSGSCKKIYREEDLKQAIKEIKDKLFIKTKKGKIVIPACKIIPTIDKIMGVWEE